MDAFSGQPARLGNVLNKLVRQRGIAEQSSGNVLDSIWKEVAGERIAGKSFVRKLRNGVLEISVTNGAILEELSSYLKHDLLQEVSRKHPEPPITSLKFVKAR